VNIRRIYTLIFGWMPYRLKRFLFEVWYTFSPAGRVSNKGERWVAGSWDELVGSKDFYSIQHAHRYFWIGQILKGQKNILDMGCGTGYGVWYLASRGHEVMGYDPSEKAIRWAKKHFEHQNVLFTSSIWDLGKFDAICSFEVIEHVGETGSKQRDNWVELVCSRLKEGGKFIVSTPNCAEDAIHTYLSRHGYQLKHNPYHHEMTNEELMSLLSRYFNKVKLYGQGLAGVYDFDEYGKSMSRTDVVFKDFEIRDYELETCPIVVAVCKDPREDKRMKNCREQRKDEIIFSKGRHRGHGD